MPCEAKDKAQFDQLVKDAGDKLVVVDFHATWCGPCKMISPKLETIEKELPDKLVIIKVDVDECEDVAASHGITAMPTFIFYKNGNRIPDCDVVGASEAKIREQINKLK